MTILLIVVDERKLVPLAWLFNVGNNIIQKWGETLKASKKDGLGEIFEKSLTKH